MREGEREVGREGEVEEEKKEKEEDGKGRRGKGGRGEGRREERKREAGELRKVWLWDNCFSHSLGRRKILVLCCKYRAEPDPPEAKYPHHLFFPLIISLPHPSCSLGRMGAKEVSQVGKCGAGNSVGLSVHPPPRAPLMGVGCRGGHLRTAPLWPPVLSFLWGPGFLSPPRGNVAYQEQSMIGRTKGCSV